MTKNIEERPRRAHVFIELNAYGSETHLENTVKKLFKELELQRFEITMKRWYDMDDPFISIIDYDE